MLSLRVGSAAVAVRKCTRERERDIANMMCLRHSLLGIRCAFSRGTVLGMFRASSCGSGPVGKLKTKVLHTLLQHDWHPHQLFHSSYFLIGFQGWTPGLDSRVPLWATMNRNHMDNAVCKGYLSRLKPLQCAMFEAIENEVNAKNEVHMVLECTFDGDKVKELFAEVIESTHIETVLNSLYEQGGASKAGGYVLREPEREPAVPEPVPEP
jgi:hypothetical protein